MHGTGKKFNTLALSIAQRERLRIETFSS